MKNLKNNYYNRAFTHVYIEETVLEHPRTRQILEHFPGIRKIRITHYKDVFCRRRQSAALQNQFPQLILAAKQGRLVYEGAAVCQSFGNEYFYYSSCVMNCLYGCEYCYLKGMYSSGNIVIFVNLEDIFQEVEHILKEHPVYLCISYDTDLMAVEDITGFVQAWMEFAEKHENLRIEIRTKCGRTDVWDRFIPNDRVIFAFTLSPQKIVQKYEHRTASLSERLGCANQALKQGFSVRLCFDPVIYCPGWRTEYQEMLEQAADCIPLERLLDVSIGSFRISQNYLKKLRREMKYSAVVQYPFENRDGVYQYSPALAHEMEEMVLGYLRNYLPENKIFHWN